VRSIAKLLFQLLIWVADKAYKKASAVREAIAVFLRHKHIEKIKIESYVRSLR